MASRTITPKGFRTSLVKREPISSGESHTTLTPFVNLSACQHEFLKHLAQGDSYKEIAEGMNVSINSVRTYVRAVYKKLNVDSRTKAVVKFLSANPDSAVVLWPKLPGQLLSSDKLICCRHCGQKFSLAVE